MAELRVPTVTVDVDIVYADGNELSGRIFLPALASRHEGPTRADEWINDRVPFFPLVMEQQEGAVLLNKDRVVVLTVHGMHPESAPSDMIPTALVRVICAGHEYAGMFQIELPEGRMRVQDYLNQPQRFIALYEGERCHLIRRIFIDRVVEIREA